MTRTYTAAHPLTPEAVLARLKGTWPIVIGLVVLYLPTYLRLATEVWQAPETFHGALFFLLAVWMVWTRRSVLLRNTGATNPIFGSLMLAIGLFLFVVGRSQDFLLLEVLSQIPVLIGSLLIAKGWPALRALWFPIVFLVFLAPLPGSILDALLMPLKQFVSAVVDHALFALGYPIARNGVVLIVGPYQLLIADACAGLNSIIALSGIGMAFMYFAGRSNRWRNLVLLASVLPIAVFANVLRVGLLTLITYHFGDDMGQRFHNVAGMAEVIFALGAFFMVDSALGMTRLSRASAEGPQIVQGTPSSVGDPNVSAAVTQAPISGIRAKTRQPSLFIHATVSGFMLAATAIAIALTPNIEKSYAKSISLEHLLPREFGDWKLVPSPVALADLTPNRDGGEQAQVYDQTVMRTYRGPNGQTVMLAVAWGQRQSQNVKVHRPELCYTAQGFQVLGNQSAYLSLANRNVPVTRLVTRNSRRMELVTYWIRLGDSFSSGPVETRLRILAQGLLGNAPDGVLVRASTATHNTPDLENEFNVQQKFLEDLLASLDRTGQLLMLGQRNP